MDSEGNLPGLVLRAEVPALQRLMEDGHGFRVSVRTSRSPISKGYSIE